MWNIPPQAGSCPYKLLFRSSLFVTDAPVRDAKRSRTMDQEINQPIEVMAVFEKGRMLPVRFRWNGRVVRIVHVTARWRTNEGRFRKKHYSVIDQNSEFFQLTYKERTSEWFLNKIWVE
jgi:nucleotidyltransferase/DNA polymerase involved in DNA repair